LGRYPTKNKHILLFTVKTYLPALIYALKDVLLPVVLTPFLAELTIL